MSDRPLCCINCKKQADVAFKSFRGGVLEEVHVCKGCPWLAEQVPSLKEEELPLIDENMKKACCGCNMTLKQLLMGDTLGCHKCYEVFSDQITEELVDCGQVYIPKGESVSVHNIHHPTKGKVLECTQKSGKLEAFREALKKAIESEDYESAAAIRDEMKEYYRSSNE